MSKIHVCNVLVCSNPSTFQSDVEFEITFDCIEYLSDDLSWKIIYVGSAESEKYDQTLDTVFVGPVDEGRHRFVINANPPDTKMMPIGDIVGVTLILLTCSYKGQEFIRIGYYVSNQYVDEELIQKPPEHPILSKLQRTIDAKNPRVKKFTISWDDKNSGCVRQKMSDDEKSSNIEEVKKENILTSVEKSKLSGLEKVSNDEI